MSSGFKTEVINTRERAVSTDINRLQAFGQSELAQVFYEMMVKWNTDDDAAPGVEAEPVAGSDFHVVLNGLRFYPLNGTVNGLITPGVLMAENSAAGADDARIQYCNDPGIVAVGTLVLTPGAGSTRIDVIECQPTTAVLETDNRDIYNTTTGLFAPVAVTKVVANRLTYRIRTGTAGAGFPGTVAGWFPLAVVRVPAAAATWDVCDIWDVRRLASELWNSPFQTSGGESPAGDGYLAATENLGAGSYNIQLTGRYSGRYKQWRVGGDALNYPSGAAYIDITTGTTNWEPGLAVVGSRPWYVYLAFPFGLPGWRKYSAAPASPRAPQGMRGIPVVTQRVPNTNRTPFAALAVPTATGLGGSTTDAVCIFAGIADTAPKMRGAVCDGEWTKCRPYIQVLPSTEHVLTTGITIYQYLAGFMFPPNAKSLLVELPIALRGAAPTGGVVAAMMTPLVRIYDASLTFVIAEFALPAQAYPIPSGGTDAKFEFIAEIPVPPGFAGLQFDVQWNIDSTYAFTSVLVNEADVRGWKLNP